MYLYVLTARGGGGGVVVVEAHSMARAIPYFVWRDKQTSSPELHAEVQQFKSHSGHKIFFYIHTIR